MEEATCDSDLFDQRWSALRHDSRCRTERRSLTVFDQRFKAAARRMRGFIFSTMTDVGRRLEARMVLADSGTQGLSAVELNSPSYSGSAALR